MNWRKKRKLYMHTMTCDITCGISLQHFALKIMYSALFMSLYPNGLEILFVQRNRRAIRHSSCPFRLCSVIFCDGLPTL